MPPVLVSLATAEPPQLLPARQQMAFTLAAHIVLACMGVAFPAVVAVANWIGLRRDDSMALALAQRWSKVMAVLFAVGAVTGTVLSFEMGLLWPGLMGTYGDVFGLPFAIEGIFFFLEAIFIAIYIYGWKRLSPRAHLWTIVPVVVSGIGGAFAVVAANAWMNQPAGFRLTAEGTVTEVNPFAAIFNRAMPYEVAHMVLAAYMVTGFVVASVYAAGMLRGRHDRYHRLGLLIPLTVAAIATPVQIVVGDWAARSVFEHQPAKFAAMELVTATGPNQAEHIGGMLVDGEVKYAISIPNLNSILAGFSPDTVVTGLDRIPAGEQPPANVVHLAFDLMVGLGFALLGLAAWFGWVWWRKRDLPKTRWFLRAVAVSGAAAIIAMEAGWIVTEVGRQPWVVYEQMRTAEAVTRSGWVWASFAVVFVLYTIVGIATALVLRGMARRWRAEEIGETDVPYGPRGGYERIREPQ